MLDYGIVNRLLYVVSASGDQIHSIRFTFSIGEGRDHRLGFAQ